jgi:hypothetical protein
MAPEMKLVVKLPPETTAEQADRLRALLESGKQLGDLFAADVLATTGIAGASPLDGNDQRRPPPQHRPPKPARKPARKPAAKPGRKPAARPRKKRKK